LQLKCCSTVSICNILVMKYRNSAELNVLNITDWEFNEQNISYEPLKSNEWRDAPVFTAERFCWHWREFTHGFQSGCQELGGIFHSYEDQCICNYVVAALQEYLQTGIDFQLLEKKVGTHRREDDAVPRGEMRRLRREVAALASMLDYES